MDENYIDVTLTDFVRDEGTLVLFSGHLNEEPNQGVTVAVDHRYASDILSALALYVHADAEPPQVSVPAYLIVRYGPA